MTMPTKPIPRGFRAALALALAVGAGVAPSPRAAAQDLPDPGEGFTWERVGDIGIDLYELVFGRDSTLWAGASRGLYRLDPSSGSPGTWVHVNDHGLYHGPVLPLGGDTLVVGTGGTVQRSLDGGVTFETVYDEGGEDALYEVPAGYPFAGRLLSGDIEDVGYSTDRAGSFTDAVLPDDEFYRAGADDFLSLLPGTAHPGRVLAAGRWGVNISDDGGATFRRSALWGGLRYHGHKLASVEGPDSGLRFVMSGYDAAAPYLRVWVSDDGGETWVDKGGLPEGPPEGPGGSAAGAFGLGGMSAVIVAGRGTVYRSDDGGETWQAVGRAPDISEDVYAAAAALGPDGRLYIGLADISAEDGWVWRMREVLVAAEPGVPEPEDVLRVEVSPNPFRGEATVRLALARPSDLDVALYDVFGRRVAVLASGLFAAGRHEVVLDGRRLASGVYLVRAVMEPARGGTGAEVHAAHHASALDLSP